MTREIILDDKDIREAAECEWGPTELAQRKFKEKHGLEFDEDQFLDTRLFRHEVSQDEKRFRITFIGGVN